MGVSVGLIRAFTLHCLCSFFLTCWKLKAVLDILVPFPSGTLKTITGKRKSSDIIQSAYVTAIRPELPCLVDQLIQKAIIIACQLLITCSVVFATADCRKYENFLRKKNNTTDRNVKKGPKCFYLILLKQKPNFPAGFSALNATSKNIPNCNLNELFVC